MAGDSCSTIPGCTVEFNGGHNYLFCVNSLNWSQALDRCRLFGGDLVAVGDTVENTWIKGKLTRTSWLGLVPTVLASMDSVRPSPSESLFSGFNPNPSSQT